MVVAAYQLQKQRMKNLRRKSSNGVFIFPHLLEKVEALKAINVCKYVCAYIDIIIFI